MVESYIRAVSNVSRALGALATFLLGLAMLAVCQMIFMRYILREATIWQNDFVVYSATAAPISTNIGIDTNARLAMPAYMVSDMM